MTQAFLNAVPTIFVQIFIGLLTIGVLYGRVGQRLTNVEATAERHEDRLNSQENRLNEVAEDTAFLKGRVNGAAAGRSH